MNGINSPKGCSAESMTLNTITGGAQRTAAPASLLAVSSTASAPTSKRGGAAAYKHGPEVRILFKMVLHFDTKMFST